jgi:hypothetical protein
MRLLGGKMEIRDNTPCDLRQDFLEEYSAEENIRRYMKKITGHGISYLLEHDYGDIYLDSEVRSLGWCSSIY